VVKRENEKEPPKISAQIRDDSIDNILSENVESFHVHEFGSTVIFLQYLEGLDPDANLIDMYSKQGLVFLLPIRPKDLIDLRDSKIKSLIYKALDHETEDTWYRVVLSKYAPSVKGVLKNIFNK
jgi:hypothetical protein